MTNNLLDLTHFEDISAAEVLVLTPNQRMQRRFSHSYGLQQKEKGLDAWLAPNVFALNTWLDDMWLHLQDCDYKPASNVLLADNNLLTALWAEIITSDNGHKDVINSKSLAGPALSAFRTLSLWQSENYQDILPDSLESELYFKWHTTFKRELRDRQWITSECTVNIITQAIKQGAVNIPPRIVLFSFDDIPPLYETLFQVIREFGGEVLESDTNSKPKSITKLAVKERQDQYVMAAQWAKNILQSDLNSTVAIVCPELTKYRSDIASAFTNVFEPQAVLPHIPRYTLPFNFSAGIPLGEVPLIRDALEYIGLSDKRVNYSTISSLLRSPYIAGAESELYARTKFDVKLKEGHTNKLNLDNVIQKNGCPEILSKSIGAFLLHISNIPYEQNPSQWAYHFSKGLESIGWPGDRNLDSEEYQALTHWHSKLDQLSKMGALYKSCTRDKALSLLRQNINCTVFQPETTDSPVQILGILEAAGLQFDHMWVMDLNDDIWPQAPKPNPFIPLIAQKTMAMPHSSSDRELEFSKRILDRLESGADNIIMSYSERDNDKELRCSTLIKDLVEIDSDNISLSIINNYSRILYKSIPMVSIEDIPLSIKNTSSIKGGSGIISAQASCPFQAFAKYRLNASEMPEISIGLSHIERGELVHQTLEFIWKKLHTQENLLAMIPFEQASMINDAIDFAFFWLRNHRASIGERLLKLERQRLMTVINQWLEVERKRAPFIVEECESRVTINIAGLPIRIKRDRVDNIEGERFLIDYKTGSCNLNGWSGERPDSPQIPLYAIADNDTCIGAAFGQVRKGEACYKGVSGKENIAHGVVPADKLRSDLPKSWSDIKSHWTKQIEMLATEFLNGIANVSPKSKSSCQNCHLSALCRI
jgi:probable DNA repair protein